MTEEEVIRTLQDLNAQLNVEGLYFNVSAVSTSILRIKEAYATLQEKKQ